VRPHRAGEHAHAWHRSGDLGRLRGWRRGERGRGGRDLQTAIASGIAGAKRGSRLGAYVAGASVPTRIRWAIDLVLGSPRADALDLLDRLIGTGVATQESVPAAFAVLSAGDANPGRPACVRPSSAATATPSPR
jgi:hypothetical protein